MTEIVPGGSGQAALFEDPVRLLQLPDGEFARLVAEAKITTGPIMGQLRRVGGLLAWAGWHRLTERNYGEFVADLAEHFGVDPSTIGRWRRKVVAAEHLAVPAIAAVKAREVAAAVETKRLRRSEGGTTHTSQVSAPGPRDPLLASAPPSAAPPAPESPRLEPLIAALETWSDADVAAIPQRPRHRLERVLARWQRALAVGDRMDSVEDCRHPANRRIGDRCGACGGARR